MVKFAKVVFSFLVLSQLSFGLWGCGLNMQTHYAKLRPHLVERDFDAANTFLDDSKVSFYQSEKNRLLFYLNKGMILHLGGNFRESNAFLEQAEETSKALWTESVTEHIGAALNTDNALSYAGEDFERILIYFFRALNFIGMGNLESARSQARKITNELEHYNQSYREGEKNLHRDDGFARWLSGKLLETEGGFAAFNDAWIDYRKAIAVYEQDYEPLYGTRLPQFVIQDALRVLEAMGNDFSQEFEELRQRYPSVAFISESERAGRGEIVFLHLSGEAPYKTDHYFEIYSDNTPMRIAFPRFVRKPTRGRSARLQMPGGRYVKTVLAQDIEAIAIQNLQDNMPRIRAKAVTRAVLKRAAAEVGSEVGNEMRASGDESGTGVQLASDLWKVYNYVSEEADKRSWITLPARIGATSFFVAPGEYVFDIDILGQDGTPIDSTQLSVAVEANKTAFLFYRSFR